MIVSIKGKLFIKINEGFRNEAYLCSAGKDTIGFGHRIILPEENYLLHGTISKQFADTLFESDIKKVENAINSLVKTNLTENQFDAIADFTFNLGVDALRTSHLLIYLNQKNFNAAMDNLVLWHHEHVNGQIVDSEGLKKRRGKEKNLFLGGMYEL